MKQFLLFVVSVFLLIFWLADFVGGGGLIAQLDKNPDRRGTATVAFYTGRYYDIMNKPEKALEFYQRVADRYPRSRYGMEALYGVASSYEQKHDYRKALELYEKFAEAYPKNKYSVSVQNNISILKSR